MVEQCKWSEGALAKPCTERNDDELISITRLLLAAEVKCRVYISQFYIDIDRMINQCKEDYLLYKISYVTLADNVKMN